MTAVGGNDSTWRAGWPAEALGGRVIRVENTQAELERTFMHPNTDTEFPWRIRVIDTDGTGHVLSTKTGWERFTREARQYGAMMAEFPDLHGEPVVFTRPDRAREVLGRALRHQGVRTISETDDNYFSAGQHNIFIRTQGDTERLQGMHAVAMASMQAVIFSTEWLRDRYYGEFRKRFHVAGIPKKMWLPEMFVCRNHIPSWHWPEPVEYDGPVRFGFMGSQSHIWDIGRLAYASFHAAKQVGCRTYMIGYNPADPTPEAPDEIEIDGVMTPTRTEESLAVSRRWQTVVDHHIRWIDPLLYKRGGLPLDISLAPLLSNDFNDGKSDIKAIEGTIAGAAVVCSSHPVFQRGGWKNETNCLMGGSQEELAMQVVRLAKDRKLRAELVAAAQEMVRTERNEEALRREWSDALALS